MNTLRLPGAWATCCSYRDGWAGAYMDGVTLKVLVNGAVSAVRFIGPARWLRLTAFDDDLVLLYTMQVNGADRAFELVVSPGAMGDPVDLCPALGQPAAVWGPQGHAIADVRYICIPGDRQGEPARLLRWRRGEPKPAPEDIPIPGGTTQGILQVYRDGFVVFNQLAANTKPIGGVVVERPYSASRDVMIGQSLDDVEGVVLVRDGADRVAWAFERPDGSPDSGAGRWPEVAFLGGDRFVASSTQLGGTVVFRVFPPWPEPISTPKPAPAPLPAPREFAAMPAFPRKMWASAFFSHSTRYGNTGDIVGNCLTLVEDETDAEALGNDLRSVAGLGLPIIVGDGPTEMPPEVASLIVGWAAHGNTVAALGEKVSTLRRTRPEKPIYAYLDDCRPERGDRSWPAEAPAWYAADVIPEIQVFRLHTESADAARRRILTEFDLVTKWAPYVAACFRFDDFNGTNGDDRIVLEDLPLYWTIATEYPVVLMHFFADRRPGGMSTYPALRDAAHALTDAVPLRPNRFDYWESPKHGKKARLLNKLGQNIDLVQLSPSDRGALRDLVERYL